MALNITYKGLPAIAPSEDDDKYEAVEWSTLKGDKDYSRVWSDIVGGSVGVHLCFPPLQLSSHISSHVLLIWGERRHYSFGDSLEFFGRYLEETPRIVKLLHLRLQLTISFTTVNGSPLELRRNFIASFGHEEHNEIVQFADINWQLLAPNIAPRGFIHIELARPVDAFHWLGLAPMESADDEGHWIVDWNCIGGRDDYVWRWRETVAGDVFWLHFPPLILPNVISRNFALLHLHRHVDELTIRGKYHDDVPADVAPVSVDLRVELSLVSNDGHIQTIHQQAKVTFRHDRRDWPSYWPTLLTFPDVPWKLLSMHIAPKATISMRR